MQMPGSGPLKNFAANDTNKVEKHKQGKRQDLPREAL
jgi:hypothetical protein